MENRKKVLIITNVSGFLWKFELDNVQLLQELGYEVHYASNIHEKGYYFELEELQQRGIIFHHIEIARSPYMFQMNRKAMKQVITIIDDEGISLIHCHTPVGGLLGRIAGLRSKKKPKVIYTAHGFHFYKGAPLVNNVVYQSVERVLAPLTDALVLINKEDYIAAQTMHLRKGGKVYRIPGVGLDFSYFAPVSKCEKYEARKKIGIDADTFFVLSVGELNQNKNHITAINAIKQVKLSDLSGLPIIYGICGDGFFKEELMQYVKDYGMEDQIRFFGYQSEIKDYYAAADITVFPSIREGLGMAALESLAMGVPVIAAENRGTREYMDDGVNGYLFSPKDVNGCSNAILKMYKMSIEDRNRMSEQCIKSVQGFSKDKTRAIMKYVYTNIS